MASVFCCWQGIPGGGLVFFCCFFLMFFFWGGGQSSGGSAAVVPSFVHLASEHSWLMTSSR